MSTRGMLGYGPFKPGDRVKYIGGPKATNACVPGATATVMPQNTAKYGHYYLEVLWDRNGLDRGQSDGGYQYTEFELIKPGKAKKVKELGGWVYVK